MAFATKAQGTQWKYEFSNNNVDVYSRWTCDGCDDEHMQLKLVNRNNVKVTFNFNDFVCLSGGVQVYHEVGARADIGPNETVGNNGDYSGLYFYIPKEYINSALRIRLTNFIVYLGGKD